MIFANFGLKVANFLTFPILSNDFAYLGFKVDFK